MDDAWKQYYDLIDQFTKEWEPRPDLRITALAHDRSVRLELGTRRPPNHPGLGKYDWTPTQRSVLTMRELAETILAACEFVESMNPRWSSRKQDVLMKKEYWYVETIRGNPAQIALDKAVQDGWELHSFSSYGEYGRVAFIFVRQVLGSQNVL